MADNSLNEDELITRRAIRALKGAAPFALVATVLVFIAAYFLIGESDPEYQSEGAVELTDERAAGINTSRTRSDALQEIDGRTQRLSGLEFFELVTTTLGEPAASQLSSIDATAREETPVITITGTASTPEAARAGVDTAIALFVAERDNELRTSLEAELTSLRSQREEQEQTIDDLAAELAVLRAAADTPQDQISILETRTKSALDRLAEYDTAIQEREFLADSANGQVRIVNPAGPATSVAANRIARPLQLAVLVLVLSLIGAVLFNRLRGKLNLLDEVRAVAGPDVPILATVPKFRKKYRSGASALVVGKRNARREAEAFRYLRTSIEVATNQQTPVVVAFTSANANEGKSVTAGNYALATARADRSVCVLDGDLLNSSVADLFGAEGDNAFLALMNGDVDPSTQPWHEVATSGQNVDLMVSKRGTLATSRQELPSDKVSQSMTRLAGIYDTIVVDCPPVLAVSDSMVLARAADVAVLVVRMGKTTRRDLDKALTQLEQNRVEVAGIVITHSVDASESYYGYGYSYGNEES